MDNTKVFFDKWLDKDVMHIYYGILLRHKKWQNNATCDNIDLSASCKLKCPAESGKKHMNSLIGDLWNRKQQMNKLINTDDRKLVTRGKVGRVEDEESKGPNIWWWRETILFVVSRQSNIQMIYYRIVQLILIWYC